MSGMLPSLFDAADSFSFNHVELPPSEFFNQHDMDIYSSATAAVAINTASMTRNWLTWPYDDLEIGNPPFLFAGSVVDPDDVLRNHDCMWSGRCNHQEGSKEKANALQEQRMAAIAKNQQQLLLFMAADEPARMRRAEQFLLREAQNRENDANNNNSNNRPDTPLSLVDDDFVPFAPNSGPNLIPQPSSDEQLKINRIREYLEVDSMKTLNSLMPPSSLNDLNDLLLECKRSQNVRSYEDPRLNPNCDEYYDESNNVIDQADTKYTGSGTSYCWTIEGSGGGKGKYRPPSLASSSEDDNTDDDDDDDDEEGDDDSSSTRAADEEEEEEEDAESEGCEEDFASNITIPAAAADTSALSQAAMALARQKQLNYQTLSMHSDHSYTRCKNIVDSKSLGVDTPSDSEDEVDTAFGVLAKKQTPMPTNPSSRDRQALQASVVNRIGATSSSSGQSATHYDAAGAAMIVAQSNQQSDVSGSSMYNNTRKYSSHLLLKRTRNNSSSSTKYGLGDLYKDMAPNMARKLNAVTTQSGRKVQSSSVMVVSSSRKRSHTASGYPKSMLKHHHDNKRTKYNSSSKRGVGGGGGGSNGLSSLHKKSSRDFHHHDHSSSSSSANNLSTNFSAEKRNLHNDLERQRRVGLKNLFEELKFEIPSLRDKDRAPKVTILREAAALCTEMSRQQELVFALRKKREKLMQTARNLQKQSARSDKSNK